MASDAARHVLTVVWAFEAIADLGASARLVEAVDAQRAIPGVLSVRHGPRSHHAGWEGPDKAFDYGMVLTFDSFEAARAYVPHPIHQHLVATILQSGTRESVIRGFWFDW